MSTSEDLLDLRRVGLRQSAFRFDVIDTSSDVIITGGVHPREPVTITHDANRPRTRDLSGLWLEPDEADSFDVFRYRIAPKMILEDGSEWPLGVFLMLDDNRPRYSWGRPLVGSMTDLSITLDHGLTSAVTIVNGGDLEDTMARLIAANGNQYLIESTGAKAGTAGMNWPVGTTLLQIVNDIAAAGGWMSPYFDHNGLLRVRRQVTTVNEIELTYEDGLNIYADSIVETNGMLDAPNRFIVVDTSNTETPIVGVYDVDPGLPYSEYSRGFVVTEVIQRQGLSSSTQAQQVAQVEAQQWENAQEIEFQGPPDPRHDGWMVISFRGSTYIETRWSLTTQDGSPMSHVIRSFA